MIFLLVEANSTNEERMRAKWANQIADVGGPLLPLALIELTFVKSLSHPPYL